jgi:hypothetical protein
VTVIKKSQQVRIFTSSWLGWLVQQACYPEFERRGYYQWAQAQPMAQ